MSDNDRRRILERRERFLRSALLGATASTALTACDPSGPACHSMRRNMPRLVVKATGCEMPGPCLSISVVVDAGAPPAAPDAAAQDDESDGEP
jgi:hypothetical protein